LGKAPAVIEAAFSSDVLDGHMSSIIEVSKGRGVVLRASDHKMPQQKPFDAVKAQVIEAWKKQRGAELAAAAAEGAVKRLQAGEAWDAVAKSLNAAPPAPKFVSRSDAEVPVEVLTKLFGSPKPSPGKPAYSNTRMANGDE